MCFGRKVYFGHKSLSPEGGLRLFPGPQPTSLWVAAASGLESSLIPGNPHAGLEETGGLENAHH